MRGKKVVQTLVIAGLMISATACGSGAKTETAAEPEDLLVREVTLSEYKIKPEHITVTAHAPVRFIVRNVGKFTHELKIASDPPMVIEVPPDSKAQIDGVFEEAGEFEYECSLNGHEKLGMKGEISVEGVD